MLVPLEKPTKDVRFEESQNAKVARRIVKDLDQKSGQIRNAIKTLEGALKQELQLSKMSHNFNTGIEYGDLLYLLKVYYDHCNGRNESLYSSYGVFEVL